MGLLVTPTMLESLQELIMAMVLFQAMVLLVTGVILAMVVSMVVTMESVKLTVMLMPTPSDKSPMVFLRLMHMLLVTPTMLESLQELIMAMVEYLAMVLLVTVDTLAPLVTVDTLTMAE